MTGIEDYWTRKPSVSSHYRPLGEGLAWAGTITDSSGDDWMYYKPWERSHIFEPTGVVWGIGNMGAYIRLEGENKMEKQLTDLVLALELDKDHVSEIREIVGHSDWRERFMLYVLARAVLEGGMEVEALGYKRAE